MVYSHRTEMGPGMGPGLEMESIGSNILCTNVHTGLRQGQGPGTIVSYCVIKIPFTSSSANPVQCE